MSVSLAFHKAEGQAYLTYEFDAKKQEGRSKSTVRVDHPEERLSISIDWDHYVESNGIFDCYSKLFLSFQCPEPAAKLSNILLTKWNLCGFALLINVGYWFVAKRLKQYFPFYPLSAYCVNPASL